MMMTKTFKILEFFGVLVSEKTLSPVTMVFVKMLKPRQLNFETEQTNLQMFGFISAERGPLLDIGLPLCLCTHRS